MDYLITMFYNISFFLTESGTDKHIDHHTDDVVRNGDKGSGCQGRINLQLVECHRHNSPEDAGKDHYGKEAE